MINPPSEGLPTGAPFSAAEIPQPMGINVGVPDEEQKQVVALCNKFKYSMKQFAREKKKKMRDAYVYSKSLFIGNDLLPLPKGDGTDKDMQSKRPQIFIPKTRQQVKTLYSYLKLTIFPNDEDFFRVRAKSSRPIQTNQPMLDPQTGMPMVDPKTGKPMMMPMVDPATGQPVTYPDKEEELTDGLKYLFKEALLTEKLGPYLQYLIVMGNGAVLPVMNDSKPFEWSLNAETRQYQGEEVEKTPLPDVEVLDPLHFYVDPREKNPDKAKWGYFGKKKKQELKDSPIYFNTQDDRLEKLATKQVNVNDKDQDIRTTGYTGVQDMYEDIEDSVDYDLFYFPYLKTNAKEYRNMLVGVAGGELLVRFHPNMFSKGMNPAVFNTWMDDTQSPYGIGAVEDMMELQRLVNMIYNHTVETLSRIGNRFAVQEGTDLDSLWGVAGGVLVTKGNPNQEVAALTGDYAEPATLMNFAGTLTAELQQVGGAQNPFQGSSNVDFKKTATELQILQENSISIIREIVEHISVMGIQRILERLMYLCADEYTEPLEIRVEKPGTLGPQFIEVDFSPLKSGQYTIELVNVNPSQSKQAQVETLTELIQLVAGNPQALPLLEPILNKISMLEGLRDGPEMIQEILQRAQQMQMQAMQAQQQQAMQQQQQTQQDAEMKHAHQMELKQQDQPPGLPNAAA